MGSMSQVVHLGTFFLSIEEVFGYHVSCVDLLKPGRKQLLY